MKILMVSMPSLHFFRWTEQLKDSGHDVYWFDITDGGKKVERIAWVEQIVGWKLRWDYPKRIFVKKNYPKLYQLIQKVNERNVATIFEEKLVEIQPDVVHSFALQISCLPILSVMQKYSNIKWIYSSWGSDIFLFQKLDIKEISMKQTLKRINYLITDCFRDYELAKKLDFKNRFLGVYPGNGGIDFPIEKKDLEYPNNRNTILIKAYNDSIGKGIEIMKSFDGKLIHLLSNFKIVLFGADQETFEYIKTSNQLKKLNIIIYLRNKPIPNEQLLRLMNKSYLYIANSLSDGLPNALLEAMGMGCFPIQSNPGNVMSEIISNNKNGLLIEDPLCTNEISELISRALVDENLIKRSFNFNVEMIRKRCDRNMLKEKILRIYENINQE